MYFVDPYYVSPTLNEAQKHKKCLQIQSILMIPKTQRKDEDKKIVYDYFINNPGLRELQRSKSLRSRILCVGQLQLITEQQYAKNTFQAPQFEQNNLKQLYQTIKSSNKPKKTTKKYIVLQRFSHDSTLIVLDQEDKQKIIRQDEQHIRTTMQFLKTFTFLKKFQYHQQLYLAHFVKSTQITKYKEFVFKQNQPVNYAYLIEEGQFQVFKNIKFVKEKSLTKNKSKTSISSPIDKYLQIDQSLYKKKQVKIVKEELSKIQGKAGQCFGQTELFLQQQNRLYSFRCNSLSSKICMISFKRFKQIFKYNTHRFDLLKKQYIIKHETDLMKISHKKYSKEGILRIQPQMIRSQKYEQPNDFNSKKLSEIIFSMDKYKTLQTQIQGKFTLPNNSLTLPINQKAQNRNVKRQRKIYSQNANKEKNNRYEGFKSQVRTAKHQNSVQYSANSPSFDSPFFPVINKKNAIQRNQKNKNTSFGQIVARRRNRLKGLINIDTIIREKEELYNSRVNLKNPQFSFYKLDERHLKLINFKKSNARKLNPQINSPVRSKHYMKSLVKQSLKKSGYLPQNVLVNFQNNVSLQQISNSKTLQMVNTSSFSSHQVQSGGRFNPQESGQPFTYTLSKQQRASLVSNDFDHFFYKI